MKRKHFFISVALMMTALALYFPILYSEYLYTDEAVQLWKYKRGTDFHMFLEQGRYVTDLLFTWLFGNIHTIEGVMVIRLVALIGWLAAIPLWYYLLRKICEAENLPVVLPALSVVYLICTPVFCISVSWASCFELFIANTAGLVSGYMLYTGIRSTEGRTGVKTIHTWIALLLGLLALFTYQNGFGCFLLPFLLHLLANPGRWKKVMIGIAGFILIGVVYYAMFKYQLRSYHLQANARTALHINLPDKLKFFLSRPLSAAFHFTYLFNEKSITGAIIYCILLLGVLLGYRYSLAQCSVRLQLKQVLLLVGLLVLIYLPGLLVKENYASNRTLLALNMAVFFWVVYVVLNIVKRKKIQLLFAVIVAILFAGNALFNFYVQFLQPVKKEYVAIRNTIESNYNSSIDTVLFIRPAEDAFINKYGITRSWDEFGVPATFFSWVPAFFVKQVIYEKTGNRAKAETIVVRTWPDKNDFSLKGEKPSATALLIDAGRIIADQ